MPKKEPTQEEEERVWAEAAKVCEDALLPRDGWNCIEKDGTGLWCPACLKVVEKYA